jgi:Uma2 family endonuclease
MTLKPTTRPDHPFRFTRQQYHEMGERGYFEGTRVERIHGEIVEMRPINWPHVVGCRRTAVLLERVFAGTAWVSRNEQPLALADSDPQPDVMVVAGRFEDYTDHPTTALLVVEVADTTLAYDTKTKAELYATAGVADYWVLDLDNRQLHVFRDPQPLADALGATAYQTHLTLSPTDHIAPLAAPTASVLVGDLLP